MGAFKQFLSTDVTVVPFVVNKSFSFVGSASLEEVNIQRLYGINTPYSSSTDKANAVDQSILPSSVYNSVKQLYYTNYINTPQSEAPPIVYDYEGNIVEDYTTTATNARFFNYEQTTLVQINTSSTSPIPFGYRRFFGSTSGDSIAVISIPKDLFGDYINPNTFYYRGQIQTSTSEFVDRNGDGILTINNTPIGTVNYSHGIIALYGTVINRSNFQNNNVTCSFQSSKTIYETQYKCTIRPDEFNYSLNPSLISGSTDGTPYNFVTGSYFSPYVTTVGLYNERQELLAVAKLAQPLPTSRTTDTTIIINLDM